MAVGVAVHDENIELHQQRGGNGSFTRTAPVALAYLNDPAGLAEAARAASDPTHFVEDAGAALYAAPASSTSRSNAHSQKCARPCRALAQIGRFARRVNGRTPMLEQFERWRSIDQNCGGTLRTISGLRHNL